MTVVAADDDILDNSHETYIDEASAGDFFVKQTMQIYKPPLRVIPASMKYLYAEFEANMGPFQRYLSPDDAKKLAIDPTKFGAWETPEGNKLLETYIFFLCLPDHDGEVVMINMQSTKIPTAQAWNRSMHSRKLPSGQVTLPFHNVYSLTTKKEKNTMGSWFGIVPKYDDFVSNEEYTLITSVRPTLADISLIPARTSEAKPPY